ncbi:MAG: alpha-D-ribose 1-methylphosphonate 5-phosphate C-P-lyase PhnJ [Bosea sp. (in: a-proteobacteria)]|nr:alpha-D-ribose 1-methylphosphonate 5-phosphate C-P-lyase PhnJ [Bosea sp. (in: a-proteobacteria)]
MNAHQSNLNPHPEEARRAVSKDAPARTETSFETKPTASPQDEGGRDTNPAYNYAYLDEQTKRMIRRALLKAVAVPGYQVPFGSREMPLARGWGTGGIQVTAAIIGPADTLKVIDQGADDTTNAVSIRRFFEKTADARTTEATEQATIIQTRHRIPEAPLQAGQIIVYQVPQPEPLRKLEPREAETRKMHAWAEYGLMQVKLYENIARFGEVTTTYDYPVMINGRYIMAPSPIPKFDNPKMHMSPALQLFGAGREKRIYALPPHTSVRSLDFEDHPFRIQSWNEPCALCAATDSYLDEVVIDDQGSRMFVCSDSHHCETRRAAGHRGAMLGDAAASGLVASEESTS